MLTLRQWFHKHPELSFEEVKTAAKVVETLRGYGIEEVYENVGKVSACTYTSVYMIILVRVLTLCITRSI